MPYYSNLLNRLSLRFLWLALVLCLPAGHSYAQSSAINLHQQGDPFFEAPLLESGMYQGTPLNTKIKRSLVELEGTNFEEYYGSKPGYRLVANFYHAGDYYFARIPIDGVAETYFQLEKINKVTEHSMIRFKMKPDQPVELIGVIPTVKMLQTGSYGTLLNKPILIDDACLTIEGVPPKGFPKFDMFKNGFNRAGLAFRLVSGAVVIHEGIIALDHRIRQLPLNLNEADSSATLMEAVNTSISKGMRSMYNVCTANCTNLAFEILERGTPYVNPSQSKFRQLLGALKSFVSRAWIFDKTISNFARWGLTWRGFRSVTDNFTDLTKDPLMSEWVVNGKAQTIQRRYRSNNCDNQILLDAS